MGAAAMGALRLDSQPAAGQAGRTVVRRGVNWGHILLYIVLTVLGFLMLIPFVWMVATSLKGPQEILSATPTFWPKAWRWENYTEAFQQVPFGRFYWNTIVVTVARTVGQLLFASLAAFAFARLRFPGRGGRFVLVLAVMMMPGQVTLVPNYVLLKYLGWLDSYEGLIIPSLFSAFGVFLLRQFYMTIPQELFDSATLDGCNPLRSWWHVGLPLSRTALVAFGVLVTLWSWNDFLWPLIITNRTEMQMLSVGIAYFQGQFVSNFAVMMAAATVATLPMVLVFLLAQRQLLEGITLSGLKG
jgi:multiple sugar transport system permease protein